MRFLFHLPSFRHSGFPVKVSCLKHNLFPNQFNSRYLAISTGASILISSADIIFFWCQVKSVLSQLIHRMKILLSIPYFRFQSKVPIEAVYPLFFRTQKCN